MLSETIGPYNAIGKIAMAQVEAALAAGWRVSVVANRLAESLQGRVEWLKLYVPRRGFALQWLTGRRFIRQAMGDPSRFDVIHGHQPQIADLCDIFQCHFLTRAAYERNCLYDGSGLRRMIDAVQKRVVLMAEDRHYRRWNPSTHMLFNSALTRNWFARYYGLPASEEVLLCPSPPWRPVADEERIAARRAWSLPEIGIVAGFLGGLHERKGYRRVIHALRGQRDVTLLMGGLHSDGFDAPELAGHFRCVGLTGEIQRFYAACDVLIVASHFEPFGYVASESAARGVPVVAAKEVGALPHLLEHEAGASWIEGSPLAEIIRTMVKTRDLFRAGCERYTVTMSAATHDQRLLAMCEKAVCRPNKLMKKQPDGCGVVGGAL